MARETNLQDQVNLEVMLIALQKYCDIIGGLEEEQWALLVKADELLGMSFHKLNKLHLAFFLGALCGIMTPWTITEADRFVAFYEPLPVHTRGFGHLAKFIDIFADAP